MSQITRHHLASSLLQTLRGEGLGVRDLFQGRQEPASWYFRGVAFDQSDLDILESGAVEELHAPSVLVELAVDELALALANVGTEGIAGYLRWVGAEGPGGGGALEADELELDPEALLAVLNLDAAPPALWLDEREADPESNEELAERLSAMAREVGSAMDAVEVHIEGAVKAEQGWSQSPGRIRPSGVAVHFAIEVPLVGTGDRELARYFRTGAEVAAECLQGVRGVFREA